MFDGAKIPNIGLNAVAGRPKEEYGIEPTAFDEMRPGCYDVARAHQGHERRWGARLDVLPVVPVVQPAASSRDTDDKDMALAVLQAYNDWHIEEWCGAYPGRFIPMALPVLWDPELTAAEVRRVAAKGCHSLTFTENPATLGLPELPRRLLGPAVEGPASRPARSSSGPPRARRASWPSPPPTPRST